MWTFSQKDGFSSLIYSIIYVFVYWLKHKHNKTTTIPQTERYTAWMKIKMRRNRNQVLKIQGMRFQWKITHIPKQKKKKKKKTKWSIEIVRDRYTYKFSKHICIYLVYKISSCRFVLIKFTIVEFAMSMLKCDRKSLNPNANLHLDSNFLHCGNFLSVCILHYYLMLI